MKAHCLSGAISEKARLRQQAGSGLLRCQKAMSKSALEVLECGEQVQKRARWEAFEFTLLGDGDVEVVNDSHENAEEHTYTVHVESGIPSDCTCPAWEFQPGACKHMVAVAIRDPVLEATSEEQPTREAGSATSGETDDGDRPEDCDCGEWNQGLGLCCWPCYRDGFEKPNPSATEDDD